MTFQGRKARHCKLISQSCKAKPFFSHRHQRERLQYNNQVPCNHMQLTILLQLHDEELSPCSQGVAEKSKTVNLRFS